MSLLRYSLKQPEEQMFVFSSIWLCCVGAQLALLL